LNIQGFKVPGVLNVKKNLLLEFEMNYINGENVYQYIVGSEINQIQNFSAQLLNYFDYFFSKKENIESSIYKSKIVEKLQQLRKKSEYKIYIDFLIHKVEKSQDFKCYISFCHGDFTLSNMVISDHSIFLIDFLDSYIESPLIDLVKIKQDLSYKWSLNIFEEFSELPKFKINQILNFIWTRIEDKYKIIIESEEFKIIEVINFLRIEPYLKDREMKIFLEKIIKSSEIYEEFNNTDVWKIK
jgi:hypothetical protein